MKHGPRYWREPCIHPFVMDYSTNDRIDRPQDIVTAIHGLGYPAPRGKVIEQAKDNNATPEVLQQLLRIPETADFRDEAELMRTLDELRLR